MAHAREIVDILRNLDRESRIPLFVVDGVGLAGLPRINAEDISYVSVAEKMADLCGKLELLNNAVAMNTARSIDNEDRLKHVTANNKSYSSAMTASRSTDYPSLRSAVRGSPSKIMPQPQNGSMPQRTHNHRAVTTSGDQPLSGCRMPPLITTSTVVPIRHKVLTESNSDTSENTDNVVKLHRDATFSGVAAVSGSSELGISTTPQFATEQQPDSPSDGIQSSRQSHHHHHGSHTLAKSASRASINSATSGNWQVPSQHVRKFDRRTNRKRIQGTASGSNVVGAPTPTRDMFI